MSIRFLAVLAILCASLNAQQYVNSVGFTQFVPSPSGGASGAAVLDGYYVPPQLPGPFFPGAPSRIVLEFSGLPAYYNSAAPSNEIITFIIDFAHSVPNPTVQLLGGDFYIPNIAPILAGPTPPSLPAVSDSVWLGPVGIPSPGQINFPSNVFSPTRNGARLRMENIPLAGNGVPITFQAFMFDPNLTRVYTSNALNINL